jgi:hypothetical protein
MTHSIETYKRKNDELRKELKEYRKFKSDRDDQIIRLCRTLLKTANNDVGVEGVADKMAGMGEKDKLAFLANANSVYLNPVFPKVIDYHIKLMTKRLADGASNWEEVQNIRMTMNGIMFIYNEFKDMSEAYSETVGRDEPYDKFNML